MNKLCPPASKKLPSGGGVVSRMSGGLDKQSQHRDAAWARLSSTSFSLAPNIFFCALILSRWLIKKLKEKTTVFCFFGIFPYFPEYSAHSKDTIGIQSILKIQIIRLFISCPFITNSAINELSISLYLPSVSVGSTPRKQLVHVCRVNECLPVLICFGRNRTVDTVPPSELAFKRLPTFFIWMIDL